ncbi:hypothetical protein E2C01_073213 [Portunus trituberculatus]|uniref:Uncharacterized protein n=1 Tax=Portunus trituberculatus TaxID=210409 RepID=A0A5B7I9Z4_PORTR|nr:hypothetical protein [Portunus trituberculatus]
MNRNQLAMLSTLPSFPQLRQSQHAAVLSSHATIDIAASETRACMQETSVAVLTWQRLWHTSPRRLTPCPPHAHHLAANNGGAGRGTWAEDSCTCGLT